MLHVVSILSQIVAMFSRLSRLKTPCKLCNIEETETLCDSKSFRKFLKSINVGSTKIYDFYDTYFFMI